MRSRAAVGAPGLRPPPYRPVLPAPLPGCQLSPLVDSGLLHLEGTVPSGTNNVYKAGGFLFAAKCC